MGLDSRALDRFMYRKDGMDYGPFSVADLQDLIRAHRIDDSVEIRNVRERRWTRLGDVPALKRFYDEFTHREAEERRRREVLREAEVLERSIRRHHRMPFVLGAVALLGLGAILSLLLRPSGPPLRGLNLNVFRTIEIASLPPLPAATPAVAVASNAAPKKAQKNPKTPVRAAADPRAAAADPEVPVEVNLAFNDDEGSGRALSRDDLNSVQRQVSGGLIRCFRAEAESRPDFRGGHAVLYILSSGRVALSRLDTTPPASGTLTACARSVVQRVQVPAFSGGAQVMEIPFYVTDTR